MDPRLDKVRGKWTPKVNYNRLSEVVLHALSEKPVRLTGNEVKFIRQYFEMTLQTFAKRFSVSHVAVLKWEKTKDKPTNMSWSTEKDLRLFILSMKEEKAEKLADLYRDLEDSKSSKKQVIQVDVENMAA